jgi:hypothetical protein
MRHVLTFTVVAVLAVSGCGEDATRSEDAADRPPETTAQKKSRPKADPDARTRKQLRRYMRENFGELVATSWYENIKGYEVNGGDVTVKTNVYPDSDAAHVGQGICGAIIGASLPDDKPTVKGITGARVLDSRGGVIKRCKRAGSTIW